MKATINDIARLAGVSKKTVSRVINNESNVGTATRERVQKVIDKLKYSPDPQARGLASRRSFLLALVYDNPNASFITEAMYGVLDHCRPKGYELVVHPCEVTNERVVDDVLDFVNRLKIDGVILLPPLSESGSLVAGLKAMDCNYVRLLSVVEDEPAHIIRFNDRAAVAVVADHFVALGHSNIGFIQGPETSQSASERYEGFRTALTAHGIDLPVSRIAKGAYTFQSGVEGAEWLLNSPEPPTAIFASNDEMAMGVIVAAKKMGFQVPSDLTVAGFDDSPHASEIWPALTTVNLQVRRMGSLATEKLLYLCDRDADKAASVQHELTPKFIQRQSTAPPRGYKQHKGQRKTSPPYAV
ncbi:LacI family DNA-binding transcriptional regulator [Microbulbifer sp.]|uniref:LacI family DNA-binding transcriptional regulator n=1 Tax=Microbulbifer sp. TaxID=1908541 RepID=UPI003F3B8BFF